MSRDGPSYKNIWGTIATQAFSGKVWWIWELDSTSYHIILKKIGQDQIFQKRDEILSITCVLFSGQLCHTDGI